MSHGWPPAPLSAGLSGNGLPCVCCHVCSPSPIPGEAATPPPPTPCHGACGTGRLLPQTVPDSAASHNRAAFTFPVTPPASLPPLSTS